MKKLISILLLMVAFTMNAQNPQPFPNGLRTKKIVPIPLTTIQIDALPTQETGTIVFDSDLEYWKYYDGAAWVAFGGGTTPDLEAVTDEGATTSNSITVENTSTFESTIINSNDVEIYGTSGKRAYLTPNLISFGRNFGSDYYNLIPPSTLTTTRNVAFPDKSGTVAFTDDITGSSNDLNDTTLLGNFTEQDIQFNGGADIDYFDGTYHGHLNGIGLTANRDWGLPDVSGTLANSINGIPADTSGNIDYNPNYEQILINSGSGFPSYYVESSSGDAIHSLSLENSLGSKSDIFSDDNFANTGHQTHYEQDTQSISLNSADFTGTDKNISLVLSQGQFHINYSNGSNATLFQIETPTTSSVIKFPSPSVSATYHMGISVNGIPFDSDGDVTISGGSGTVTNASVVSANGFAGSVATSTTTPAITLSTTVTGLLKGNGTAISAATAGTDYTTPSSTETVTNKSISGSTNTFTNIPQSAVTNLVSDLSTITTNISTNTANIALKSNTASPTFTGTVTIPNGAVLGTPTSVNLANATFPTLNQNTSGTAANLSGTPALPNGTTATTQSASDNSTKIATTAYADTADATKWSLATGGTLTGTNTITAGSNSLILSTGVTTGSGSSSGLQIVGNSLTTGRLQEIRSNSITTGSLLRLISTSTAGNGFSGSYIDLTGSNANSSRTVTGQTISVANTGTSSTNIGLNVSASGATNNYAALFTGSVGIDQATPTYKFDVTGTGRFTGTVVGATPTLSTELTTKSYVDGYIKAGSFSQAGTATTTFTVTIGSTMANTTYKVNVTPTAALSAAAFYVTNKTTTTFDVMYLAGLTGTVTFDFSVVP